MSYWIFRDLDGTALTVEEEEIVPEIVQERNGVWIGEIRKKGDIYEYYKITRTTGNPNPSEYTSVYQLRGTIHPITKDQYETYQEFGLFSDG